MDLTHLRLTGMAGVGQQYGAVGPVPNPPKARRVGFFHEKQSTLSSELETQS